MKKMLSIAIDGPAGSGKSTVADIVAQKLGLYHLDTGAMYRAFGYCALRSGVSHTDRESTLRMLQNTEVEVAFDEDKVQHVFVNGVDVTDEIRKNEVSKAASDFGTIPEVRYKLVELQRKIASERPVILDGRDICKYVLPNADIKIYLTADARVRAERRLLELRARGQETDKTLEEMASEIEERDRQDMQREISPLSPSEDATIIDSTSLTIKQVCDAIIKLAGEN